MDDAYEWDEAKNQINQAKHGVGFDVVYGLEWDSAVVERDERYAYGEPRFRAFGRVAGRPHCIAFTPRGERLRIISVRPMHEKEARIYGI
jgi:uncharacterized DUF497 family protein